MIDNYLLEELVTFAQTKTLAKAAQQLHVTQPTLTRGMQKLETELGVQLFQRRPNRIVLTATGVFAAETAAKLLQQNQSFATTIRNFDQTQTVVKIRSVLPGPLMIAEHTQSQSPQKIQIDSVLLPITQVSQNLENNTATLIFSDQNLATDQISSQLIGIESLAVNLNKFMYQANQTTIHFADLKNLSFIVLNDIGPWRKIIQQAIPGAKFFYQAQQDALMEITAYSDFPYFSTNLSKLAPGYQRRVIEDDSRVRIPLSDDQAQMPVYASYLTRQSAIVQPLLQQFQEIWPD